MLDIRLHQHVETLFQKILDRCIITYFFPFKSVSLQKMADTFNMDKEAMELLVEKLIMSGRIKGGRINSRDGILSTGDGSGKSIKKMKRVIALGTDFAALTENLILRLSCLQHDLVVSPERSRISGTRMYSRQRHSVFELDNSDDENIPNHGEDTVMMDLDEAPECSGNM